MNHLYKKTGWLGMVLLIAGGCKKFVTVSQPQNTITTEALFANEVQAASSLAGLYSQMMLSSANSWSDGGTAVYTGLSSDELVSRSGVLNPFTYAFESSQVTSTITQTSTIFWAPLYKDVYVANAIIEGAGAASAVQLSDSARHQLIGEAKFVRALCYFYLTNLFGDVPLVLFTDFNKTNLLGRTSPAAVYTQILSDLKDAESLLGPSYSVSGGERIRPNKWAVIALEARVSLYQKDWKDADDQASSLIGNTLFSLVSDLNTVFSKNSTESIWQMIPNVVELPFSPNDILNFLPQLSWSSIPPSQTAIFLIPSLYNQYGLIFTPTYYLSPSMGKAFEPNDQRKIAWTGFTPTPSEAPWTGDTLWWPNKYTKGSQNFAPAQYYTVFRLAEQYLIRAEARVWEGNTTGALADLNVIRARAGLPPSTASSNDELLAAIAQERRVEFFAEWGHRYLDLKRTGKAAAVLGAIPAKIPWHDYQLLYPIPQTELATDPNLSQNQGY
ncbi:RagB/SusD family nutrient uptake outer membrane protein [Flavitalea flava]